jgi:outer membrane protein assembly factor BamA
MKFLDTVIALPLLFCVLDSFSLAQERVPAPKPGTLAAIEFTGNKFFDQETLRRQFRLVRVGDPYVSEKLAADIDLNLIVFLKENGFMQCEVTWEERSFPDGSIGVRIKVAEGLQYHLSKLEIIGVKAFTTEEIAAQFHLRPGDVLNLGEVKRGLERIKRMYSDKGFIDLSYVPEQDFGPATQRAGLTFTFQEGIRYRIAYVGIVGCGDQGEEDRVRATISLRPGDFFQLSALEAAAAAINKLGLYREVGEQDYSFAPIDEKPGLLSVVFYLKPKPPLH